jgi:hypothetical protein
VPRSELTKFHRNLRSLEYTRKRMEGLFLAGKISKRDLDAVYESLFLRAVTSFEGFLEDLFMAILERRARYSSQREVSVRIKVTSKEALSDILRQGYDRDYLNWLPFHRTETRARVYLEQGKPFSELNGGHRSMIQTITTIRHAIAHRSKSAMGEFERTVVASRARTLGRGERSPAGFLQSRMASRSSDNMFQVYVAELGLIAQVLS